MKDGIVVAKIDWQSVSSCQGQAGQCEERDKKLGAVNSVCKVGKRK